MTDRPEDDSSQREIDVANSAAERTQGNAETGEMAAAGDTSADAPVATGPSAGQLLREGRAARDMSVAQLATETRIKQAYIELLEADQDPEDQAPVFVRGYYRRCARVLGLPENEVLQAYERRAGSLRPTATEPAEWVSVVRQPRRVPFPGGGWALLAAVAIFVCVIVGVALLREASAPSTTVGAVQPPPVSAHKSAHAATAPRAHKHQQAASVTPPPAAATQTDDSAAATNETAPVAAPAAPAAAPAMAESEPAPAAAASAPVADNGHRLTLRATDNCWVSIRDTDGKSLFQGIIGQGQSRQVQGQPPYQVVLGNARVVTLSYAGKPVDISSQIEAGRNTARFSIPLHN